jgi:hypothetical protein
MMIVFLIHHFLSVHQKMENVLMALLRMRTDNAILASHALQVLSEEMMMMKQALAILQ